MYFLRFLAIRLMEGVGLERVLLEGRQVSRSCSLFSVLVRLMKEYYVFTRARLSRNSGYLPIGSPWPLLANLNLVSWLARL